MTDNDELPDNRRCARTDGRQWRCKRRVFAGKKYCQDHLIQFQKKAQRKKQRVKSEVKVSKISQNRTRIVEKSKEKGKQVSKEEGCRKRSASEALDEAVRKMKLKKGDIQLELIREYVIRKVEKKKEKEMEESESGVRNIIKEFPNGRMEIPPPLETSQGFDNVGPYNVKVGTNCKTIERRNFRSKNVEPLPVCTMQILPNVKEAVKFKKGKRRKCHWCRKSSYRILVKCKGCQKESFCEDCIEERSFVKEEVRIACPVCRGACRCRACSSSKPKDVEHKESIKDTEKIEKLQQLHYLIQMLLPVLKKMNLDQSIELEIEAKIKGARNYVVPQVKLGCENLICCHCNTSIVDFHRSCTRCSYNLCLSCCHEFRQGKLSAGLKENKIMYPYRKRACTSDNKLPLDRKKNNSVNEGSKSVTFPKLIQNWGICKDGRICCPPKHFGGCGGNISLDLRCLYPFGWDKELEASVTDIVSRYDGPDASEFGSCCSICRKTAHQGNGVKLLLETARRDNSNENFLYYPNVQDLHVERLGHFQNHWGKGHPVIVQSVIEVAADMKWDPVTMFCSYLGKSHADKADSVATMTTNYLDWFEVELSESQIFMGSLEGQTNAFVNREKVKFNGCLFPNIFREQFPEHYAQVMQFMPLKEYMDPMSGLFNLAAKLPEDMPKPNLGPFVHIAYGEPEEFMQGQFVTRLSYDSYDVGKSSAMAVSWVLGVGALASRNSIFTIGDYYYKLFPDYHPDRVLTLVYQSLALATMVLFTYKESKINTRRRNMSGYILFFLTTLALVLLDLISSGKGGSRNYIVICVFVAAFGVADAHVQGGMVGDLSLMCPEFVQSFFGGMAASGALTSALRLITKAAFEKSDSGLRKGAIMFLAISTLLELVCIYLYAYVFPNLPVVKYYRTKAALEGSKTVSSDLVAVGIQTKATEQVVLQPMERLTKKELLFQNIDYAVEIFMIFLLSLSIFPGFLYENTGKHQWGSWYPLVLIAVFNLYDLIGRYIPLINFSKMENRKNLLFATLSRFLLVPAFHFTAKYGNPGLMLSLVSFLGLSNGYLTVCIMTAAPKGYKGPEKNALGNILVLCLLGGIFAGVSLDWLWLLD